MDSYKTQSYLASNGRNLDKDGILDDASKSKCKRVNGVDKMKRYRNLARKQHSSSHDHDNTGTLITEYNSNIDCNNPRSNIGRNSAEEISSATNKDDKRNMGEKCSNATDAYTNHKRLPLQTVDMNSPKRMTSSTRTAPLGSILKHSGRNRQPSPTVLPLQQQEQQQEQTKSSSISFGETKWIEMQGDDNHTHDMFQGLSDVIKQENNRTIQSWHEGKGKQESFPLLDNESFHDEFEEFMEEMARELSVGHVELWNHFQLIAGGAGTELQPLVHGSIQKEQARLSQESKAKLQWIRNEAIGSNIADGKQLVNDRELKREKRETQSHVPRRVEMSSDVGLRINSEIQIKSDAINVGREKSSAHVGEEIARCDTEVSSDFESGKVSKLSVTDLGNQSKPRSTGSPDAMMRLYSGTASERDNMIEYNNVQGKMSIEQKISIGSIGSETISKSCESITDMEGESNVPFRVNLTTTPSNQDDDVAREGSGALEEDNNQDCVKTPWAVQLRKVSVHSKSPGSKSDKAKTAVSQHIWPVKLKKTEIKERSHDSNSHGEIEAQLCNITPRQLHAESECLASEVSNGGHHSLIPSSSNIENDSSKDAPTIEKDATAKRIDNLLGETIDLSQLPSTLFPQGSRTKIIPISNNKNTRPQVVAMGCELAVIAQKSNDDGHENKAKVLWYFNYKNVQSLNMLASCEENIGAVGAEILVVDGPSYPLYFETFAVYMDFVQTFYNFKNNQVGNGIEEVNKICKEGKDVQTYDENEWKIITMYREMLRRGTPRDAVAYQLDIKSISKRIRDAVFAQAKANDESVSLSIQKHVGENKGMDDQATPQTTSHIHPLAAMIRNHSRVKAECTSNVESCDTDTQSHERPTHPLASLIKSRAEKRDVREEDQLSEAVLLPSQNDKHPPHPLAAMIKARSNQGNTHDMGDGCNPIAAMIKARVNNNNNTEGSVSKSTIPNEPKSSLKDNPKYAKYFQMLKIGLPMDVVRHALQRDGLDPTALDENPKQDDGAVPLKDDPKYAKYFKMLKVGLCMEAVKNAMVRDGEDPSVIDGDHNLPASSNKNQDASTVAATKVPTKLQKKKVKDKFVRTRVFWDTLEDRIEGDIEKSVWGRKGARLTIHIDEEDFRDKFQAEISKNAARLTSPKNNQARKKTVQVIDEKRANNGGISLALLKGITFEDVANAVDNVESTLLSVEQVAIVEQYLPTDSEKVLLSNYMRTLGKDPNDLYLDLCECEKFMVKMKDIERSREKVKALRFILEFSELLSDLQEYVRTIELACDELKKSQRFREILIFVLELGNKLNTAGREDTKKVSAITLFSINKLSETKAVDKKTTVLEFIVEQIVKQNESIASFRDDIPSVLKADSIDWTNMIENQYANIVSEVENLKTINHLDAVKAFLHKHDIHEGGVLLSDLQHKIKATEEKFNRLTREYFLEKEKRVPHEWFANITTFTKDFYEAKKRVTNRLAAEEKKKQRNANKKVLDTSSVKRPEIRKNQLRQNLETIKEDNRLQDVETEPAHCDQPIQDTNVMHNWQPSVNDTPEVFGCQAFGLQVRLPLIPRRISFHDDKRTPVSATPEHHQAYLQKCQDHITGDVVLPTTGVTRSNSLESLNAT